jgi:hypothetical protein
MRPQVLARLPTMFAPKIVGAAENARRDIPPRHMAGPTSIRCYPHHYASVRRGIGRRTIEFFRGNSHQRSARAINRH